MEIGETGSQGTLPSPGKTGPYWKATHGIPVCISWEDDLRTSFMGRKKRWKESVRTGIRF
jgi:hypothetical protein